MAAPECREIVSIQRRRLQPVASVRVPEVSSNLSDEWMRRDKLKQHILSDFDKIVYRTMPRLDQTDVVNVAICTLGIRHPTTLTEVFLLL